MAPARGTAKINRLRFTIGYPHERYLTAIVQAAKPKARGQSPYGVLYAEALHDDLQSLVRSGSIETNERNLGEAGGPGTEWDYVSILVVASFLAGTYADWRQVITDLRTLIDRLKSLGDGRILIDEYSAQAIALDHVANGETFADTSARFVAKLRGADDDEPEPDRGYLVGLRVNDSDILVVVGPDGRILGVTRELAIDGMDSLGI